ncbi:MAG: thioesterase family protein [Burkholderiales bacterium]|nr:thioesterase family protein [Burkholderiales bacterium]
MPADVLAFDPRHAHDPEVRLRVVPFTRALGAELAGVERGAITFRLPCRGPARGEHGGVDARAMTALLDHACGAGVYAALREPLPIATLDLRVAFERDAPPGAELTVTARAGSVDGSVAFVEAAASAPDGVPVARAAGAFIVGAHPGGGDGGGRGGEPWRPARAFALGDAAAATHFADLLGLVRDGPLLVMPFADRLVGAMSLPALHGGAVAALLATAARELARADGGRAARLAAMTIQYLRAGRAESTSAEAVFEKRGTRSSVVAVSARQGHGAREVARAQCTFVAPA